MGVGRTTVVFQFSPERAIQIKLWDVAGQERYPAPINYYNDAIGVMLVYDISSRSTYENMKLWLGEVQDHAPAEVGLILVGNKSDLHPDRAVSYKEAELWASKLYYFSS